MPRRLPSCWRASVERCWEPMLPSCRNPLSCSHTQSQRPLTEESKSCSRTILQSDKIAYKSWISLRNSKMFFVSTVSYSGKGFRSSITKQSISPLPAAVLARRNVFCDRNSQISPRQVRVRNWSLPSVSLSIGNVQAQLNSLDAEFWISLPESPDGGQAPALTPSCPGSWPNSEIKNFVKAVYIWSLRDCQKTQFLSE